MIQSLAELLETATWVAPLGALLWGLASVLLSPCHLSSVPLLVGFLGRLESQRIGAGGLSAWVTAGVSLSLVVLAGISLLAGRILGDLWGVGPWVMVVFLLVAGLYLMGAFEIPTLGRLRPDRVRAGAGGAVGAGGVLGLTLGPCTFAFFAPVLAFGASAATLPLKVTTVSAFVVAHLGATWVTGVLGARVAGLISRGGRWAGPIKAVVGLAAVALAVEMIITLP